MSGVGESGPVAHVRGADAPGHIQGAERDGPRPLSLQLPRVADARAPRESSLRRILAVD